MIRTLQIIIIYILFQLPVFAHPGWGIDFDSRGNLYFTDIINKTIWKLSQNGELTAFSEMKWSHQLFVDEDDNIIICNEEFKMGNGWNSVIKISPNGDESYIVEPTKYGMGFSGSLIVPINNLIVYEYKNNLFSLNKDSGYTKLIDKSKFSSITNLHIEDNNTVYIVDDNKIKCLDQNGKLKTVAENLLEINNSRGAYGGKYNRIYGIDLDTNGNIYAAYYGNSKVLKISPEGTKAEICLSQKNWYPVGVKMFDNHLFVLEEGHAENDGPTALRIIKLDSKGNKEVIISMGHIGGKSLE